MKNESGRKILMDLWHKSHLIWQVCALKMDQDLVELIAAVLEKNKKNNS